MMRAHMWSALKAARTSRLGLVLVAALFVQMACGDAKKSSEPDRSPASLQAESNTTGSATVGTTLAGAQLPSVKVLDASGAGVAGVEVTFVLATGIGSISGGSTTTSSAGVATLGGWTLGTTTGENVVTANVAGVAPLTFTRTGTAGPGVALAFVTAPQATVANRATLSSITVRLRDSFGNDATTPTVNVVASVSGGTLSGTSSVSTASTGSATFANLAYTGAAVNRTLTFTATGMTSVSAVVAVTPAAAASLVIAAGNSQTGVTAGGPIPIKPAVRVVDADDNGVAGVAVTFAVASGGGTAFGVSQVTDASGNARVSEWQLGELAGVNTLTASTASPVATQTFTATSVAGAAVKLAFGTAPGASAVNRATLPSITLQLQDVYGNAATGPAATVVASVSGGGALTGTSSVATSASGSVAFANLAYQGTVGTRTLTFSATGLTSASAVLTITPGAATKLAITAAPSGTAPNRVLFSAQPALRLVDADSNTVSQAGVAVNASIASGGGTLNGATTVNTNASGVAIFSNLSIAGVVGARTLSFGATGLAAATANLSLTAGAPASIASTAGAGQSANGGAAVATLPAVTVTDADGNGVPGVRVAFSVTSGGGNVTGNVATTNSSGVAAVTSWVLGQDLGVNRLSAAVVDTSVGGILFTVTPNSTVAATNVAGNPVLFTATSVDRPSCSSPTAHTPGTTTNGTIEAATDCMRNFTGPWTATDLIQVTAASQTAFQATMNWVGFSENVRQVVSWWGSGAFLYSSGIGPQSVNYVVAPGAWTISATSTWPLTATAPYTFASTTNPSSAGCYSATVTIGVTINDALDTGCNYTTNAGASAASKIYYVSTTNNSLNVTMTSGAFVPKIEIYRLSGFTKVFVSASTAVASPATLAATGTFLYEVRVTHTDTGGPTTGAYTVTFAP